jgi:hypothetical protein
VKYVTRYLVLLALLPALSPAQNISCALSGSVQDPSNAAIAGAQVTLVSEQRGFVRTASTNSGGFFSFPDLTADTPELCTAA